MVDDIKAMMTRARREKDDVARNVLGLALGEIQTAEARANRPLRDEETVAVVRKLLKSNEETLSLASEASGAEALRHEIEVLSALLPAAPSPEAIESAIAPVADAVRAARSEGQAMGVAMKHLKTTQTTADAPSVLEAIRKLRG
ncbi:MAG TPA: GatB/YqeY domain-containing protein [Polyangiaceae bacterium]|nr:GatB/YqeY domain-containing protein [Polyangiaceae bacterium]